MKQNIIFTGGGSGGHVVPALTLIEKLRSDNFTIHYIGNRHAIEAELTAGKVDYFYSIPQAKLRRYLSFQNFIDLFKLQFSFLLTFFILLKFKRSTLIFSMGGFISLPVVIMGALQGKSIYIHEQTSRVGLANKIASFFAKKVFVSFPASLEYFPANKTTLTGYPVRESCYKPAVSTLTLSGVQLVPSHKPLMFVTGGGNGSLLLNELIIKNLEFLKERYIIVHQVGAAYLESYKHHADPSYFVLPFIKDEMIELFKHAEIVICRSGAGTVAELLAIGRRAIYIPLKIAQKNEQFYNALEAQKINQSIVLKEDDLLGVDFQKMIEEFEPKLLPQPLSCSALTLLNSEINSHYLKK